MDRRDSIPTLLQHLWQDIRHGCRMLVNNPGFTLIAVVSLAIGIGANAAMYSWAEALMLRPMPVPRPGEVVTVGSKVTLEGFTSIVESYPDFRDLRDHNRSFSGLAAFNGQTVGLAIRADAVPQRSFGMLVSGNFFEVMGVQPSLGRAFRKDEDQVPGRDAVLILDYATWEQQFAADRAILGRKLRLNGIEFTVIGVAPEQFTGPILILRPAFYVPVMMMPALTANPKALEQRDSRPLTVKARLRSGVSLAEAQAELDTFARSLERAYPDTNKNQQMVVRTEFQARTDQDPIDAALSAMLLTLSVAVLIVACINVAGLLTSQAPARAKEIALRLAVGAGRGRLIRQLITESLLVALLGALLGVAVGYGGVLLFRQIQIPSDLPLILSIGLNQRVLLFSLAVAVFSVFLFGLIPAFRTTRVDLAGAMKTGDAAAHGKTRLRGRAILVACQVAVSLVLLTMSAFMYRGFRYALANGQGFRHDHLLMMNFDPSLAHSNHQQTEQFYKKLLEQSRTVPGVKSVALSTTVPMGVENDAAAVVPEGYQLPAGKQNVVVFASRISEHYFGTMGVRILRGRAFNETDTATSPGVAVVNEQFAQHYWPGKDAVGKRLRVLDGPNSGTTWVEIVGVAETGKYIWIAEPPTDYLYLPEKQSLRPHKVLFVESAGDPASLAAPLRDVVRGIDPTQPVFGVRTMEDFYNMRVVSTGNSILEIVAAMGVMGLLLATVGLYGLGAYAVSRRTREIGIRAAIGATQATVLKMILRQGMTPTLIGVALGVVGSAAAERLMVLVFPATTGKLDITSYLVVTPALLAIAAVAAFIPARRASRVDPMQALRHD